MKQKTSIAFGQLSGLGASGFFFISATFLTGLVFFATGYVCQSLFLLLKETQTLTYLWPLIGIAMVISFPILAGLLSLPFHPFIRPGIMPRKLSHPNYFFRRLYGLLWSMVFYSGPIYWAVCSFSPLKWIIFKLFGLRGQTGFSLQPDTWIRDLPVLKLSGSSYIANKATLGSNLCLQDEKVIIDHVTFFDHAMLGHLSAVGPGVTLEECAQLGVVSVMGIRAKLKQKATTAGNVGLNHGCVIGPGANIGASSYIGVRSQIGAGVIVPPFSCIPDGAEILTQEQMNAHHAGEANLLRNYRLQAQQSSETVANVIRLESQK